MIEFWTKFPKSWWNLFVFFVSVVLLNGHKIIILAVVIRVIATKNILVVVYHFSCSYYATYIWERSLHAICALDLRAIGCEVGERFLNWTEWGLP